MLDPILTTQPTTVYRDRINELITHDAANVGVPRVVASTPLTVGSSITSGDYMITPTVLIANNIGSGTPVWIDPAQWAIPGRTARFINRVTLVVGTTPGVQMRFTMYGVNSVTSAAAPTVSLAGNYGDITVASTATPSHSKLQFTGPVFDVNPAVSMYMFGIYLGATTSNNASVIGRFDLLVCNY